MAQAQLPAGWVASRAYLEVPQVIVRRESAAAVLGLEDLRGRSVASPDRLPLEALLAEQAPARSCWPLRRWTMRCHCCAPGWSMP